MELKVWVEGIIRVISGVTANTTCQDVVFALAHATGKIGRFTLILRWHNNERHLAPDENPLKLLLKGVEHGDDVQFILQCSENKQQAAQAPLADANQNKTKKTNSFTNADGAKLSKKPLGVSNTNNNKTNDNNNSIILKNNLEYTTTTTRMEKYFNDSKQNIVRANIGKFDAMQIENIGVVHGIQQCDTTKTPANKDLTLAPIVPKHEKSHSNPIELISKQNNDFFIKSNTSNDNNNNFNDLNAAGKNTGLLFNQLTTKHSKSINEINLADVRNALERRTKNEAYNYAQQSSNQRNIPCESIFDGYAQSNLSPTISANGALVPPPYRDPPPPRNSPLHRQLNLETASNSSTSTTQTHGINLVKTRNQNQNFNHDSNSNSNSDCNSVCEDVLKITQNAELLQLIKYQREKISAQQAEICKYDVEIGYLENRDRDQAQELEFISREISKANQIFCQGSEQLQTLQYVEEENELVKQQEKTLKSEIALLRSKLANCESELQQCKNKIRLLMDDIELEQYEITQKQKMNRQTVERDFIAEMERIQTEIDQALQNTDSSSKSAESLKREIQIIESVIAEKKCQVEQLVNEMKEVNLKSLTVTTSDEIKHLLEGHNKLGSSRRIIGSPRQLENALPTSKNPHGVWV